MKMEGPVNKNEKVIEWELPTDIDAVDGAEKKFAEKISKAGWDDIDFIKLAFREAVVNAIFHGNLGITKPDDTEKDVSDLCKEETEKLTASDPLGKLNRKVKISLSVDKNVITVTICDEGEGFDPKEKKDPTNPENLMKTKGRGRTFMEFGFDKVTYNTKGNEVTMVKERKK